MIELLRGSSVPSNNNNDNNSINNDNTTNHNNNNNNNNHCILLNGEILAALLTKSGLVRDRKTGFLKHKQCFQGNEAVDWVMLNFQGKQAIHPFKLSIYLPISIYTSQSINQSTNQLFESEEISRSYYIVIAFAYYLLCFQWNLGRELSNSANPCRLRYPMGRKTLNSETMPTSILSTAAR